MPRGSCSLFNMEWLRSKMENGGNRLAGMGMDD